jgi:ABC-type phosphate transport system ATPase subunit
MCGEIPEFVGRLPRWIRTLRGMREARCAAQTSVMNTIARWAVRTAALWALAKALELANRKLKQRQRNRLSRARATVSAAP